MSQHTLDNIHDGLNDLSIDKKYHVHCAGGYRSVIYASIAQSHGFKNIINISGYGAIKGSS
jgi:rhodanese-related sulfurtransferase